MDLLQVKVIGDQLAREYPDISRELILLSVMRVLREHEASTKEDLKMEIESEIKRFRPLHPSSARPDTDHLAYAIGYVE